MIAQTTTTEIRTETLADVVARQSIVPEWLANMIQDHGPDATVVSMTRITGFGNYLTSVTVQS